MTTPFLLTFESLVTSILKSDDKSSVQIHKYGRVIIDRVSQKILNNKKFYTRFLSKVFRIGNAETNEITIIAYDQSNKEVGSIFIITENLIAGQNDNTLVNNINATGIFEKLNNVRSGRLINKTNQVILFL